MLKICICHVLFVSLFHDNRELGISLSLLFFKSQFDMDEISLFYHLDSPKVRAGRKQRKLTALVDAVSSFVVESVISFLRMLLARAQGTKWS